MDNLQGTRPNPDPTIYRCPIQGGTLVPGIFTLNLATRSTVALASLQELSSAGCCSLPSAR
ncbi:MAG: hypothetical protein H0W83_04290 [Planctomycetes bacterium]|nr:hypothetical protein [Planctomycetota bacterium]